MVCISYRVPKHEQSVLRILNQKTKIMAQIKNSPLVGLRGTLGDLVFRTTNGKTFVYMKSGVRRNLTAAQKKSCERFRIASALAKHKLRQANMQMHYHLEAVRLGLPNAYTAALREALRDKTLKVD